MSESHILNDGVAKLGLDLNRDAQAKMLGYLALMRKWNRVYNLTAIRDETEMVSYHLLDSLAVLPYLWQGRWLDVGCGGGVPGLVLAIARPDWEFTLLDSNSKKTGFVQQAAIELGLDNVKVYTGRVEEWSTAAKFEGIISRAFTELGRFFKLTEHLLADDGKWAAMKGKLDEEMPTEYKVEKVISLTVPNLNASRSLVIASKLKG